MLHAVRQTGHAYRPEQLTDDGQFIGRHETGDMKYWYA